MCPSPKYADAEHSYYKRKHHLQKSNQQGEMNHTLLCSPRENIKFGVTAKLGGLMPSRRRLIVTQEVLVSRLTSALVRHESRCALARNIHHASDVCLVPLASGELLSPGVAAGEATNNC